MAMHPIVWNAECSPKVRDKRGFTGKGRYREQCDFMYRTVWPFLLPKVSSLLIKFNVITWPITQSNQTLSMKRCAHAWQSGDRFYESLRIAFCVKFLPAHLTAACLFVALYLADQTKEINGATGVHSKVTRLSDRSCHVFWTWYWCLPWSGLR